MLSRSSIYQHYNCWEVKTSAVCGQVGYWKDLLEILVKACVGADKLQERKDLQAQTRNFMKWVCPCT